MFDHRQAFIFDFDGTLCDSLGESLRILNRLAPRYGYRTVADQDIARIRTMSARELLCYLQIPAVKLPLIMHHARQELHVAITACPAFPAIPEVLQELERRGAFIAVVTSNAARNVERFLCRDHIPCHVLCGGSTLFGKHHALRRLVRRQRLDPRRVFYCGDETRDIQAAHAAEVKAVAVSWGFAHPETLRDYQPDYLVAEPAEILRLACN